VKTLRDVISPEQWAAKSRESQNSEFTSCPLMQKRWAMLQQTSSTAPPE
jgi:hypothetical protein